MRAARKDRRRLDRRRPEGEDAAARLAGSLERNPTLRVALVGHTDRVDAFRSNLELSRRRAEAMSRSLVHEHGIAEERVAPIGVGALAPVASNQTGEGRASNRPVEAVLID